MPASNFSRRLQGRRKNVFALSHFETDVDVFAYVDAIRSEIRFAFSLFGLGLLRFRFPLELLLAVGELEGRDELLPPQGLVVRGRSRAHALAQRLVLDGRANLAEKDLALFRLRRRLDLLLGGRLRQVRRRRDIEQLYIFGVVDYDVRDVRGRRPLRRFHRDDHGPGDEGEA